MRPDHFSSSDLFPVVPACPAESTARGRAAWIGKLAAAGLFGLALSACTTSEERSAAGSPSAPPVEAVQARVGSLPLVERISGTIRAENQVVLYPEFTGRVAEVFVGDGDTVLAGQPLVRISDDQVREQVRQAEAGYRVNQARLRQAQARLSEADAQTRRSENLNRQDLVSDLEYETLVAQRESAAADVELTEAQLEQAAATLAERQDLLSKSILRAPIDGVVGSRNAEVGMQATPNNSLFTIGDLSRLNVRVNLTDTMLGYIEVGQPVNLIASSVTDDDNPLQGTLTRISPFLNEITRSTEAEIEILNPHPNLRPGMFLPVDVLYGESRQATLVPAASLFTDPNTGREGIFVVEALDLRAPEIGANPTELSEPFPVVFKPISAIARGSLEVAIADLEPRSWVVTLGQDLLASGRSEARVRPVTWLHVMRLQGLKREDLLNDILESTGTDS